MSRPSSFMSMVQTGAELVNGWNEELLRRQDYVY